jgi:hypothetical protein
MKINIDLARLKKKKLTINQYLLILKIYYKTKSLELPFTEHKGDYLHLRDSGFLYIDGSSVGLKKQAVDFVEDNGDRDYDDLATQIRELFPKGAKADKWPWRSTVKDLSHRLAKLDKSFGLSDYTDDQILMTTENYVNRFSSKDMDSGMQICKYFIEKDGSSTLMDLLGMIGEEPQKQSTSSIIKL